MGPQSAVDREFIYISSGGGGGSSLFSSLLSVFSSLLSVFSSLLSFLFSLLSSLSSLFSLLFSKKRPQNQITGLSSTGDANIQKKRVSSTRDAQKHQLDLDFVLICGAKSHYLFANFEICPLPI